MERVFFDSALAVQALRGKREVEAEVDAEDDEEVPYSDLDGDASVKVQ